MPVWHRLEFARADPDTQERLKLEIIGDAGGVRWAQFYDATPFSETLEGRVGSLAFREASPIFPALERLCEEHGPWTVVQIGSSSGRELGHYAARYPTIQFIGTDVVPEVVRYAAKAHQAPNLRFIVADAKRLRETLSSCALIENPVVVLSNGILQYIGPAFIGEWFRDMAAWAPVRHLLLNEGVLLTHGPPNQLRGSFSDASWCFTHDYRWYAELAGWHSYAHAIIYPFRPPDAYPLHGQTALCFYHGVRATRLESDPLASDIRARHEGS